MDHDPAPGQAPAGTASGTSSRPSRWGTGQCNAKQYNDQLWELIAEGKAKPSFLVSHELPPRQAAEGYDHFGKREVVLPPARKGDRMTSRADRLCAALGRGLLAGLVGTAAMTVSSTIEAKASGRGSSTTPGDAVSVLVGIKPTDAAGEARLNNIAHWGYGTTWGIARGVMDLLRLRGRMASLAHFCAVLGAEQILLPALGVAKPTPSYGAIAVATDTLHHAVYAVTTGFAYDYLADR